jgi:hypothetical protein
MSIEINSRMNCGTLQEYSVVVAEKLNFLSQHYGKSIT